MGVCYMVKSTAVASIAGIVYNETKVLGEEYKEYQNWGLQMQTTGIIAILLTLPLGIIATDFLGPLLLSNDTEKAL